MHPSGAVSQTVNDARKLKTIEREEIKHILKSS